MIEQKYTRVFTTEHRDVETGVIIAEEGIALVFVKEGERTVVRPSTGASGEVFAGVSLSRNAAPAMLPFVAEGKVGSDLTLTLPRIPMAGQIMVRVGGDKMTIGASAPADATAVMVDADTVTFHADHEGEDFSVQIMYEPTVSEARAMKGDAPVGGLSSSARGVVGLITRGDFATNFFDASADFSGALRVKLGADGVFTTEGSGTELSNVVVTQAPTAANPLLVLSIR